MNKIFYVIKKKIPVHMLIIALLASLLFIFPASATSNWSMPRPSSYTVYDDIIARASTDGRASVGVGVQIADYIENTSVIDYDTIRLKVSVSANTRVGIQYDITRSFVTAGMMFLSQLVSLRITVAHG